MAKKTNKQSCWALNTQAGKISAWTDSFYSPVHTGCTPLHDPPGRQVRECSPSKRYPGLQVKSHLESTSKPRVHVYLPCGIRCSTRQRISETAEEDGWHAAAAATHVHLLPRQCQSWHVLRHKAVPDHRRLCRHWMELRPSSLYPLSHFISHRDPRVLL